MTNTIGQETVINVELAICNRNLGGNAVRYRPFLEGTVFLWVKA